MFDLDPGAECSVVVHNPSEDGVGRITPDGELLNSFGQHDIPGHIAGLGQDGGRVGGAINDGPPVMQVPTMQGEDLGAGTPGDDPDSDVGQSCRSGDPL